MVQSILQAAPVLGIPAAVGEAEEADGLLQPRDGVVVVARVVGHLRGSAPPRPTGWASLACIPSSPCPIPPHTMLSCTVPSSPPSSSHPDPSHSFLTPSYPHHHLHPNPTPTPSHPVPTLSHPITSHSILCHPIPLQFPPILVPFPFPFPSPFPPMPSPSCPIPSFPVASPSIPIPISTSSHPIPL